MLTGRPLPVDLGKKPDLVCVVDTEEEFDWSAPLSRDNTDVRAARQIGRLYAVLSAYGVKPTYMVDYPIVSQADGRQPFKEMADSGECVIGAHLHPWVNPPYEEAVSGRNSFGCNLEPRLEREKIRILRNEIGERFGRAPLVYKAGRYGVGVSTLESLEALNFVADTSVNPCMDLSSDGGPCFLDIEARPFLFGDTRDLVEVPCTAGYTGIPLRSVQGIRERFERDDLKWTHVVGVLSRLHVSNKVMLSPEGHTLGELKGLTRTLMRQGVRTFSLTLHSPSVEPGCTPYVRTRRDLQVLLDTIDAYLDFFLGRLGGEATTVERFARDASCPAQVGQTAGVA